MAVIVAKMDVTDTVRLPDGTITAMQLMFDPGTELTPLADPPELPDVGMHLKRELTPVIAFNEEIIGPPISARVEDVVGSICDVGAWIARNLGVLLKRVG